MTGVKEGKLNREENKEVKQIVRKYLENEDRKVSERKRAEEEWVRSWVRTVSVRKKY